MARPSFFKDRMKTIEVAIPQELLDWLDNRARETGASRAHIVREAIQQAKNGPA